MEVKPSIPTSQAVREYWERFPLLTHEVGKLSPQDHWERLEVLKLTDIERFALHYWHFSSANKKKILDIGCGPGWLTTRYAIAGGDVSAIDLTSSAVEITRSVLLSKSLQADVRVADAENLPFAESSFDLIVSSGVMHHTPSPENCFSEAFRVVRPGGIGRITLYRLGALHMPMVFPIVRWIMRLTRTAHPGADLAVTARTVEEFIRQYDGLENPIGVARTDREWQQALEAVGWKVISRERHYFPLRMVPALRRAPRWVHRALDRYFGTMVYFTLSKP